MFSKKNFLGQSVPFLQYYFCSILLEMGQFSNLFHCGTECFMSKLFMKYLKSLIILKIFSFGGHSFYGFK